MRIRTKLLLVLLALAVPPLVGVCFYAVYEGRLLGHELAARAADAYRRAAEQDAASRVLAQLQQQASAAPKARRPLLSTRKPT